MPAYLTTALQNTRGKKPTELKGGDTPTLTLGDLDTPP